MEIVGRRLDLQLRPELLDHLLAVQAVARRQGQELDQAANLASPPLVVLNRARANRDAKVTQKLHPQLAECCLDLGLKLHSAQTDSLVSSLVAEGGRRDDRSYHGLGTQVLDRS